MEDFLNEYGIATLGKMNRTQALEKAHELNGNLISQDIAITAGYGDVWTSTGYYAPSGMEVDWDTELDTYVVTKNENLPGTVFHDVITDETIGRSYTREAIQYIVDNSDVASLPDLENALVHKDWTIIRVINTPDCVDCKVDLSRFK